MAVCKFCSSEIIWTKEGRKNVAINGDGSTHKCDEMIQSMKSIKTFDRNSLSRGDC